MWSSLEDERLWGRVRNWDREDGWLRGGEGTGRGVAVAAGYPDDALSVVSNVRRHRRHERLRDSGVCDGDVDGKGRGRGGSGRGVAWRAAHPTSIAALRLLLPWKLRPVEVVAASARAVLPGVVRAVGLCGRVPWTLMQVKGWCVACMF